MIVARGTKMASIFLFRELRQSRRIALEREGGQERSAQTQRIAMKMIPTNQYLD
jgi:hypothetical protein